MNPRQYVTELSGGSPATYGSRYIFGFIDRTTLAVEVRVNFTLKPDLNLDLYAQPFAASGLYYDLGGALRTRPGGVPPCSTDGMNGEGGPGASKEARRWSRGHGGSCRSHPRTNAR